MATAGGVIPARLVERAERCAWSLLRGWSATRGCSREDLVQEALLEAWGFWPRLRSRERFPAVVGTIARRIRVREATPRGPNFVPLEAAGEIRETRGVAAIDGGGNTLRVAGRWVETGWLRERLGEVLASLGSVDRTLLLEFHGGRSCRELAEQHGLTASTVKARLHRCRRELRSRLERAVRADVDRSELSDGATATE